MPRLTSTGVMVNCLYKAEASGTYIDLHMKQIHWTLNDSYSSPFDERLRRRSRVLGHLEQIRLGTELIVTSNTVHGSHVSR